MEINGQNPSHTGVVVDGPVVTIQTTAPIKISDLRRKFKENVEFVIDYSNSKFVGDVFLTYLSNLNLKCRIEFGSIEDALELLKSYLNSPAIANVPEMEDLAMNIIMACESKFNSLTFDPTDFIRENSEILSVWISRLKQLPLFAMYSHVQTKPLVDQFPVDEDESLNGINYVQLIKHELFPIFIEDFSEEDLTYNNLFFNEYCFAGQNLFNYFAVKNNPLFTALMVIDDPKIADTLRESVEADISKAKETLKGIEHVPSA